MTGSMVRYAPLYLAVILVAGGAGVLLAWWLRRYTTVSIRNTYFAAVIAWPSTPGLCTPTRRMP